MKIVQTFYNYNKDLPIANTAGFLCPEFHWMSMALSCSLLKKHFGFVTLYCNQSAKEIIVDQLKLPYDEVVIIPDFMEDFTNLWALPKIHTYSCQNEPFIHVDNDWFMFDKLDDNLLSAPLIGQNIEYDDQNHHRLIINGLIDIGVKFPLEIQNVLDIGEILNVTNAGVIGGMDISFFKVYVKEIYDFINVNYGKLINIDCHTGILNSIYEQLFYYEFAKIHNIDISYCTPGEKLSTTFDWMQIDFTNTRKHGYMHLIGNLKKDINAFRFVSMFLGSKFPELHANILSTCKLSGIVLKQRYFDFLYSDDKDKYKHNNLDLDFKRTLRFIPKFNYVSVEEESFISHLNILVDECCKNDSNIAEVFHFEKTKFLMKQSMNENLDSLFFHQSNRLKQLQEVDMFSPNPISLNISLSKEIFYKEINSRSISYFLKNESICKKLSQEDEFVLVLVPDATSIQIHELILYGLNLKIFKLIQSSQHISISYLINILMRDYNITSKSQKIELQSKLSYMLIDSIEKNLYQTL